MFGFSFACNQDVVEVDCIRESPESLCCVFQSKRHREEFVESESGDHSHHMDAISFWFGFFFISMTGKQYSNEIVSKFFFVFFFFFLAAILVMWDDSFISEAVPESLPLTKLTFEAKRRSVSATEDHHFRHASSNPSAPTDAITILSTLLVESSTERARNRPAHRTQPEGKRPLENPVRSLVNVSSKSITIDPNGVCDDYAFVDKRFQYEVISAIPRCNTKVYLFFFIFSSLFLRNRISRFTSISQFKSIWSFKVHSRCKRLLFIYSSHFLIILRLIWNYFVILLNQFYHLNKSS